MVFNPKKNPIAQSTAFKKCAVIYVKILLNFFKCILIPCMFFSQNTWMFLLRPFGIAFRGISSPSDLSCSAPAKDLKRELCKTLGRLLSRSWKILLQSLRILKDSQLVSLKDHWGCHLRSLKDPLTIIKDLNGS